MIPRRRPGIRLRGLLRLPLPRLYTVLSHGQRPIDPVQFEVQSASVTHRLALVVAPPQCGGAGAAVCAAQPESPRRSLKFRHLSHL